MIGPALLIVFVFFALSVCNGIIERPNPDAPVSHCIIGSSIWTVKDPANPANDAANTWAIGSNGPALIGTRTTNNGVTTGTIHIRAVFQCDPKPINQHWNFSGNYTVEYEYTNSSGVSQGAVTVPIGARTAGTWDALNGTVTITDTSLDELLAPPPADGTGSLRTLTGQFRLKVWCDKNHVWNQFFYVFYEAGILNRTATLTLQPCNPLPLPGAFSLFWTYNQNEWDLPSIQHCEDFTPINFTLHMASGFPQSLPRSFTGGATCVYEKQYSCERAVKMPPLVPSGNYVGSFSDQYSGTGQVLYETTVQIP